MKMKKLLAAVLAASMLISIPVYAEETTAETVQSEAAETEVLIIESEKENSETQETETEQQIEMEDVQADEELTDAGFNIDIGSAVENAYQEAINQEKANQVKAFVTRLYTKVLNRKPDEAGLNDWVSQLKNHTKTGAEVAQGFICSRELANRKLSDSAYVEMLYQTFFDRASDKGGKTYWMNQLAGGMSRNYVFRGFANSAEFQKICDKYDIIRGTIVLKDPMDQNEGITKFVYRCYQKFLGRKADMAGLNDWCNRLLTGQINAKEAARGFVMSSEFQNQGLDNDQYVETMYQGLFDRASDVDGYCGWIARLETGRSREAVFYGFADSEEFRRLAASFGLFRDWASTPTYILFDLPIYFTLELPLDWEGHYVSRLGVTPGGVTYYTFDNKENQVYYESGYKVYGGHLFTIERHEKVQGVGYPQFNYPSWEMLCESDDAYYIVRYPTDVQFDYMNAGRTEIYTSMQDDIEGVLVTFSLK